MCAGRQIRHKLSILEFPYLELPIKNGLAEIVEGEIVRCRITPGYAGWRTLPATGGADAGDGCYGVRADARVDRNLFKSL
jgi:hypothetical protein